MFVFIFPAFHFCRSVGADQKRAQHTRIRGTFFLISLSNNNSPCPHHTHVMDSCCNYNNDVGQSVARVCVLLAKTSLFVFLTASYEDRTIRGHSSTRGDRVTVRFSPRPVYLPRAAKGKPFTSLGRVMSKVTRTTDRSVSLHCRTTVTRSTLYPPNDHSVFERCSA